MSVTDNKACLFQQKSDRLSYLTSNWLTLQQRDSWCVFFNDSIQILCTVNNLLTSDCNDQLKPSVPFKYRNLSRWIKLFYHFVIDSLFARGSYDDARAGCSPVSWWMSSCGRVVRSGRGMTGRKWVLCSRPYNTFSRRDILWYVLQVESEKQKRL